MQREREFATEHYDELSKKYTNNIKELRTKKTKETKHPEIITEPRPGPLHLICALCWEQFKDFIEHIFSVEHLTVGVKNNQDIFDEIDNALKDLPSEKNKPL